MNLENHVRRLHRHFSSILPTSLLPFLFRSVGQIYFREIQFYEYLQFFILLLFSSMNSSCRATVYYSVSMTV